MSHFAGRARAVAFAFVIVAAQGRFAAAQTAANVLLVVNDATPTGEQVARRYAQRRGLPASNVCHVSTSAYETIARAEYLRTIEGPVWQCLAKADGQDRILYIVLTKGMPLRIDGTGERNGTVASVDSELTLLYRRRAGYPAGIAGSIPNPYFAESIPIEDWKPFSHQRHDIYLVTRLDGYTVDDALALIDRGIAPVREGRVLLDGRASVVPDVGNRWLHDAADRLNANGFDGRVVLDETARVITNEKQVIGYYSWGTNDRAIRIRHFDLAFLPGALAAMFVSSDGRTMKEPPADWVPGEWEDRRTYFGGSPQSLAPDLIRDGVTGTAGHVAEPYLNATIRPDILFPAYVRGMNLAEAFYLAMPFLSWQTIVFGDPLCAPFRERPITETELNPPIDAATASPAYFGKRRIAVDVEVKEDARRAYARFEVRRTRGDIAGAKEALKDAIDADAHFTAARLSMATLLEGEQEIDRAMAEYRAILDYAPNESVALNNLAFHLAVHGKAPAEALPLAERAVTFSKDGPLTLDTLAWVHHLLGHHPEAEAAIARARDGAPDNAEILWHAAEIYLDAGDAARALASLSALLTVDPSAAERPDVKKLKARLETLKKK